MPAGKNHSNFALNTRLSAPRYDTWCKSQVITIHFTHNDFASLGLFHKYSIGIPTCPNSPEALTLYTTYFIGKEYVKFHEYFYIKWEKIIVKSFQKRKYFRVYFEIAQ